MTKRTVPPKNLTNTQLVVIRCLRLAGWHDTQGPVLRVHTTGELEGRALLVRTRELSGRRFPARVAQALLHRGLIEPAAPHKPGSGVHEYALTAKGRAVDVDGVVMPTGKEAAA
ncbi:MAG TPA: hypothetical protein VFE72_02875 [Lysobacter sp.]|nr:hypothetical protein [Lysobacter sp.]